MPDAKMDIDPLDPNVIEDAIRMTLIRAMNYGQPLEVAELANDESDRIRAHIESGDDARLINSTMKPLAKFLTACSQAEEAMSVTLATVLNPTDPARITSVLARMPVSVMIDQLRSALPARPHYRTFLKKAKDLFAVRNTVAHGQVHSWKIEAPVVQYGRWVISGTNEVDVSGQRLRDLRRDARLVAASAVAATVIEGRTLRLPSEATFGSLILMSNALVPGHLEPGSKWVRPLVESWYPTSECRIQVDGSGPT